MEIIKHYLTESDLSNIDGLIGQEVFMIYSKSIDVDIANDIFEAHAFSLRLENSFFCIETKWISKPHYEFYKMELSFRDDPIGIARNEERQLIDPSSIHITPSSEIVEIELFTEINDDLNLVEYDSVLLFKQKNGSSFLLGTSQSIADLSMFIRKTEAINKRLEGLRKRKSWKK